MNYLVNLFKKVFFGKTPEAKVVEMKPKSANLPANPTNYTIKGRVKTPRMPVQNFGHNNRKTTEARRIQTIHQKDGTTRTIFHSTYTS